MVNISWRYHSLSFANSLRCSIGQIMPLKKQFHSALGSSIVNKCSNSSRLIKNFFHLFEQMFSQYRKANNCILVYSVYNIKLFQIRPCRFASICNWASFTRTSSLGNMAVSAKQAKGSKLPELRICCRSALIKELTARRISRIGRITLIAVIRIKSLASDSVTHRLR